jgi:hypothetical protein
MTRNLADFNTDDPLLIELGKIYRAWLENPGPESELAQDIQNAVTPYLSKPGNAAKGLPTNIGFEQTPEQKRVNVRRAIESVSPVVDVWADVSALDLECQRSETHYEPTEESESLGSDRWRGKIPDGFQDYAE